MLFLDILDFPSSSSIYLSALVLGPAEDGMVLGCFSGFFGFYIIGLGPWLSLA